MNNPFPDEPDRRRAIMVLDQHALDKVRFEARGATDVFDDQVHILKLPLDGTPQSAILQDIVTQGLGRAGTILVQSPYDETHYEEASRAPFNFAITKHMYFSMLCKLLGARELKVEQIDLKSQSGTASATFGVGSEKIQVNADGTIAREKMERLCSKINLHVKFAGSDSDIAAAEKVMSDTGLRNDPSFRSLLELRRNGPNQLVEQALTLHLSDESKSSLHLVGRLAALDYIHFSTDYRRVFEEQYDLKLSLLVRF